MSKSQARKKIIVVAGPSGVGKTFLARQLLSRFPEQINEVKIYTTRKPRTSETVADRIFITRDEFKAMQDRKEFWFFGEFHNNLYGYSLASLEPNDTHLIVNIWPYAIEKFSELDNSVIIGLTILPMNIGLLKTRMLSRGDSEQTFNERLPLIQRDTSDIEKMKPVMRAQDRLFYVANDDNLPKKVIPWVTETLDLKPKR